MNDNNPTPKHDGKPPMSELGQSIFDMMNALNEAYAMQAEINAFFARKD